MKVITIISIVLSAFVTFAESNSLLGQVPILGLNIAKTKLENIIENSVGGTECGQDLRLFIDDFYALKFWALQMLDASPKLNSGLLSGNFFPWGHWDQCLGIKHRRKDGRLIEGQYCYAFSFGQNVTFFKKDLDSLESYYDMVVNFEGLPELDSPLDILNYIKMVFSMCVPKSCTIENLNTIAGYVEKSFNLPSETHFHKLLCDHKDRRPVSFPIDVYIYIFFGVLIATVILSTVYDVFIRSDSKEPDDSYLTIFSLRRNYNNLIAPVNYQGSLSCLDGIRSLSSIWIVLGHSVGATISLPNINYLPDMLNIVSGPRSVIVYLAVLTVDTFFILSGLTVTYVYLSKNMKIGLFQFYFARWVRFVAPVIVMALFYISVIKYVGDGPLWSLVDITAEMCYKGWFIPILQLSNLSKNFCLGETWHTSVDFQFFLMAPLFIFSMKKYPKIVFSAIILAIAGSFIYIYHMLNLLTVETKIQVDEVMYVFYYIYAFPPGRAYAFFSGMALGFVLYKIKNKAIKLPAVINFILTIGAFVGMYFAAYSWAIMAGNFRDLGAITNTHTWYKVVWCSSICWIIFYCYTSKQNIINKFLSHRTFNILNKLVYSLYICHIAVLTIINGQRRVSKFFTPSNLYHDFCGDLVYSYLFAIALYLMVEAPSQIILSKLLRRPSKTVEKKNKEETSENTHRHEE